MSLYTVIDSDIQLAGIRTARQPGFGFLMVLGLFLVIPGGPCRGAEPQIAFVVADGWVTFKLQQDGQPVAGARVRVLDAQGRQFAEGETGPEGRGLFPLPPGASLMVEVKLGERTADLIRLTRTDDSLVPTQVLLSFGLRPCCRGAKSLESPAPEAHPLARAAWPAGLGGVLIVIGTVLLLFEKKNERTT